MDPWRKIMRAYNDPRGIRAVRLTADDVELLGGDSAIEVRAQVMAEDVCEKRGRHLFKKSDNACSTCGEYRR